MINRRSCYVIAEAGVNHNGSVANAKKLVDIAKNAGADAVKFQSFRAENIITRVAPKANYHLETTGPDTEQSWFDLLKSQELDENDHQVIANYCAEVDIDFLSTPYDKESVDLLDELGVKAFKIASTDANNTPFLRYVAEKRRPVMLSTAMCTLDEVKKSVSELRSFGASELTVLHCTGSYPAPIEESNLNAMIELGRACDVEFGYSDHNLNSDAAIAAVALGAKVYEKHITIDCSMPGPDHRASLESVEFCQLIERIRVTETALGDGVKQVMPCESENRIKLRKFIVAKSPISLGDTISSDKLTTKRTGGVGLEPQQWDSILGRTALRDIQPDQPLEYSDFSAD